MEVLRRCPLAIAQRLVHCANALSTVVLDRVTKTMSVAPLLTNNLDNSKQKTSNLLSPAAPPYSWSLLGKSEGPAPPPSSKISWSFDLAWNPVPAPFSYLCVRVRILCVLKIVCCCTIKTCLPLYACCGLHFYWLRCLCPVLLRSTTPLQLNFQHTQNPQKRRENYFSLRWLLFPYPSHPRVTAVARERSWSFCQKCSGRLQLNTHAPYLCGFELSNTVKWCMVEWYIQNLPRDAAVSRGTSHVTTN